MLASDISFGEGRPVRRVRWEHQCGRALTEHARAEEECLACTIERLCATGNFHAGNFHAEGCFACTGERDLCATSLASARWHGLTPGRRSRWGAFDRKPADCDGSEPRACGATRSLPADGVGPGLGCAEQLEYAALGAWSI
jgi:hypothetical protein